MNYILGYFPPSPLKKKIVIHEQLQRYKNCCSATADVTPANEDDNKKQLLLLLLLSMKMLRKYSTQIGPENKKQTEDAATATADVTPAYEDDRKIAVTAYVTSVYEDDKALQL